MDDHELEDFEQINIPAEELGATDADHCSAKQALDLLDSQWYGRVTQLGRWMDIIGDYAGEELFLLDGDSLLGVVLDDPLLALGRENDNSFQFLHARYSLERVLQEYRKRNAVFEVVFFEDHRHVTYRTGAMDFVTASRILARSLLKRSLKELQIPMHTFQGLDDNLWVKFFIKKKPMFILTDDGGSVDEDTELRAARALKLRTFIFDVLASGMAVALMRGTMFRDSKIFSFIYEQRAIIDGRKMLDTKIWAALDQAGADLDDESQSTSARTVSSDRIEWLCQSSRTFLASVDSNDSLAHPLLYVFIAQAIVLDTLSINSRAQSLPALHPVLEYHLRCTFLPQLFRCLEKWLPESPTFREMDIDGRIFLRLLQIIIAQSLVEDDMEDFLGSEVASKVVAVCKTLDIAGDLSMLSRRFQDFVPDATSTPFCAPTVLSVLPFSHPVFNEHLAPVHVDVDSSSPPYIDHTHKFDFGLAALFEDKMHWHNAQRSILPKHIGGGEDKPISDFKLRRKALRREQNFHKGLQRQAESLTGALGKPLEKIVIPPVGTKNQTSKPTKKVQEAHEAASKKGTKKKLTSIERARLEIQEEKQKKKDIEDSSWWSTMLFELERLVSPDARIQKTDLLLRNPRAAQPGWLAVELRMYRLHLELVEWINHPKREDPATNDKFRVSILKMVKDLGPRASQTAILSSVLAAIGFSSVVPSLSGTKEGSTSDRKLAFDFVKVFKKSGTLVHKFMRLNEHPSHWMLRCFGEYMDRSLESKPDQRVPFEPDGWQRRVLDSLDEEASVLVVAPTSAGKTFISYYAMERVLRSSDDGILVYVAPTKALVTQIAAEVSARYAKDTDGRSCWAVHTRDYRIHDPQKCQILITVPEVLAIMLLSPALARVWTPRLKRIILDEIHSIGQENGGSVWEQILLLAPCPIIGLSATVGEPQQFNGWLSSVQSAHNFKHTFIEHPHRYSHLRKYFYLPSKVSRSFAGLLEHRQTDRLRFLHPVSLLASGMARAIPPDFALEAHDCLSLFNALKKEAHVDIHPDKLEALDPTNFFAHDRLIKQADILRYEKELKSILDILIRTPGSHEASSTLQAVVQDLSDPVVNRTPEFLLTVTPPRIVLEHEFINLISDLHAQGDLPALAFSFDRNQCELLVRRLLDTLVDAENTWRKTSSEWYNKIQAWERYQAKAKERELMKERSKRQRPDEDQSGNTDELSWEARFDPSDPSPNFSFAGVKTSYDTSSLDDELGRTSTPDWAKQALKRGIAVHHSGMNVKYRNIVETLFRIGFLRVVVATGTLALGINAPCRTVVFFGDSTYLTALQYRQAAGRAGRRGFDLLGKVIFYGLPLERVQRLVLSRLPPISGQFPLSTTLSLRLFNLLSGSKDAPYAVKAISAVLALPQISIGSETGKHELLHQLRFSIDYLLRAHLLSADGQPLNLTGIATHLYYHEPNNLAFVALLRSGVIHEICNDCSKTSATDNLMLVLCHLFGRHRLPRSALNENTLRPLIKRYPSKIVLPPLPHAARKALTAHGALTLRVFTGYACTYASQYATQLGPDDTLPLSRIQILPSLTSESKLSRVLISTSSTPVARSAFVATSGHTDIFASVRELCHDARRGLHLNENAIPSMDDIIADDESPFKLNAFLLDFYTHGQVNTLVRANGIKRGNVWFLLQDFDLTLKTIKSSIQELLTKVSKQQATAEAGDYLGFEGVEDDDDEGVDDGFSRPPGVNNADWRVYEVVSSLSRDFNAKFRAMWA